MRSSTYSLAVTAMAAVVFSGGALAAGNQAEKAPTNAQQQQSQQNTTQQPQGMQTSTPANQQKLPPAFANMRADQLVGKTLYGPQDEEIGEIQEIVRDRTSQSLAALVDVGGFLGIGEKEVAIQLSQLTMEGDRIEAQQLTKASAEDLPAYDSTKWVEVDSNRQLSEVPATADQPSSK